MDDAILPADSESSVERLKTRVGQDRIRCSGLTALSRIRSASVREGAGVGIAGPSVGRPRAATDLDEDPFLTRA